MSPGWRAPSLPRSRLISSPLEGGLSEARDSLGRRAGRPLSARMHLKSEVCRLQRPKLHVLTRRCLGAKHESSRARVWPRPAAEADQGSRSTPTLAHLAFAADRQSLGTEVSAGAEYGSLARTDVERPSGLVRSVRSRARVRVRRAGL